MNGMRSISRVTLARRSQLIWINDKCDFMLHYEMAKFLQAILARRSVCDSRPRDLVASRVEPHLGDNEGIQARHQGSGKGYGIGSLLVSYRTKTNARLRWMQNRQGRPCLVSNEDKSPAVKYCVCGPFEYFKMSRKRPWAKTLSRMNEDNGLRNQPLSSRLEVETPPL